MNMCILRTFESVKSQGSLFDFDELLVRNEDMMFSKFAKGTTQLTLEAKVHAQFSKLV